ncbi:MAG: NAD(P)-binding protein [bacterium]|nr:NAD(P)-binding protein [bacterium]
MNGRDRELGMGRAITRRDLLGGMGIALSGSLLLPWASREALALPAEPNPPAPYPPALTGLRGSHPGSFEVAHAMRDGERWSDAEDSGETYDLIVVGGGLSGLSAAWFYRQKAVPEARILILDNHDDFGGHAKRNELHHQGRMLLGVGGTFNVEDYDAYGRAARRLLRSLEIDVTRDGEFRDRNLYDSLDMRGGFFFDRETFGTDRLVVGREAESRADFLARTPLSENARRSLVRLDDPMDYLPDLSRREKRDFLRGVSYREFLLETAGVHPDAMPFLATSDAYWAIGIDALSAWGALWSGYPGLGGLGFPDGEDGLSLNFPDGNASIARLLVQSLIPGVTPKGDKWNVTPPADMERIVTARLDYSQLDLEDARVRLRLESTAVHVAHRGAPSAAREVEVTYVQGGAARKVRAAHCVLACYNSVIPHLCPELPGEQRRALSLALKAPLVYTNVLLRNWTAFHELGVRRVRSPGCYHNSMRLARPIRIGDYRPSIRPEDPTVLFLARIPLEPGLSAQDQWRAGRLDLLTTTFETFEREIRDQLGRTLQAGGFDPARDIEAITVNRWPHGYAYGQDVETGDVAWVGDEVPPGRRSWELGRKPFGRIAIANSDAGGNAMTEAAIGEARRAVRDLAPRRSRRRRRG